MGKPNFSFQKRQKELAKKRKNEEKRLRKLDKHAGQSGENQDQSMEGEADLGITGDQAPQISPE